LRNLPIEQIFERAHETASAELAAVPDLTSTERSPGA
jgi:hypothetical protein